MPSLTAEPAALYRFLNFSTRPAVSRYFCLPVKNGWHAAQMPTWTFFAVEPTV